MPKGVQTSLPAPVRGWIENENLASNGGLGATVLENGFPLTSTVRIRGGALKRATVGAAVEGLMTYSSGGTERFFAATASNLYDITSLNSTTVPAPVWTQLTSGRFSAVQVGTAGGQFLVLANGSDPMLYYNGTTWNPITSGTIYNLTYKDMTAPFSVGETVTGETSSATGVVVGVIPSTSTLKMDPVSGTFLANENLTSAAGAAKVLATQTSGSAIALTGVDSSDLSFLWIHANRLWAVEKDTMKAWYLAVDSVGGTATSFFLGAVFTRGGSLLFGGRWSVSAGEGYSDKCVFVSDQGEIAVYTGTDPSSADTWSLDGVYDVGAPVSTQTMRAGGDLIIATTDGLLPLSQIVMKDPAALSMAAVSYNIEAAWRRAIRDETLPVQVLKASRDSMAIIGYPHRAEAHVVNLTTGAWAKWTNHDVQCVGLYGDRPFFGDSAGNVFQADVGGADNGMPYAFRYSGLPNHLGAPGAVKQVLQARATFRSLAPFSAKLSVATDYRQEFPSAPSAAVNDADTALWDSGKWDVSKWDDGPGDERVTATTLWRSIGKAGFSASAQVQITSGGTRKPDAELVAFDLSYIVGGTVV